MWCRPRAERVGLHALVPRTPVCSSLVLALPPPLRSLHPGPGTVAPGTRRALWASGPRSPRDRPLRPGSREQQRASEMSRWAWRGQPLRASCGGRSVSSWCGSDSAGSVHSEGPGKPQEFLSRARLSPSKEPGRQRGCPCTGSAAVRGPPEAGSGPEEGGQGRGPAGDTVVGSCPGERPAGRTWRPCISVEQIRQTDRSPGDARTAAEVTDTTFACLQAQPCDIRPRPPGPCPVSASTSSRPGHARRSQGVRGCSPPSLHVGGLWCRVRTVTRGSRDVSVRTLLLLHPRGPA